VTQPLQEPIQFGKYTLYERIGRGGMADVFKGRIQGPAGFERVFVVKRILPHLSDDPTFIRMFVDEAKLSARLNHPNIVQIFELGSVEGEYFISMEYVPGHDLAETMRAMWKKTGAPRVDLVAYVGREICRALGYAHGLTDEHGQPLGMIHRDVSPSNVMLSYEGAVKLLDFGIAKALNDSAENTKSGTLKGKYAYMAPEQTEGDNVDHRIDIFAAGIVLHEVLTGRRLFKGANDIQTLERVRRCEIRPPSQLNPACPPEMDAILLRALSRDRNDRFATAGEMADALDEIVHASHFTPQHMSAILRDTFDDENIGGLAPDRRLTTTSTTSISTVSSSGARSTSTVPPIALSQPRATASHAAVAADAPAAAAMILTRPIWKRGSFWMVAVLCAAGVGVGVIKGVGPLGASGAGLLSSATPNAATARPAASIAANRKAKHTPVLIQSDPEGADIFVAGKLESVGTTPTWVTLELDKDNPARVMFRKAGFQDKAIAVEVERPPMVDLIPIGSEPAGTGAASEHGLAESGDDSRSGAHRSAKGRPAAKRKKTAGEAGTEANEESGKEGGKEPGKEPGKEGGKEGGKEPGKDPRAAAGDQAGNVPPPTP
jgi:serine/threonine protein kinase